jgi:D-arabinose 1-dehydrogenase-like Zn-dependent alcohol dehydrogenase
LSVVAAYVAPSAEAPLEHGTITRREIGPKDVLIEIAWTGICHSDIHTVRGDWGPQQYPLTVGHEIAGIVTAVGSEVTRHQVPDRVAVGCMVNSCRDCVNCRAGQEQVCLNGPVVTYAGVDRDGTITQGGYSLDGTLVNLGASAEQLPLHVTAFGNRRRFENSSIGGIPETQEMLDFCAEHGIAPEVEIIPAEQINQAWDRVLASDVRFRFVIDISTLTS